jgi:hypothetical protein
VLYSVAKLVYYKQFVKGDKNMPDRPRAADDVTTIKARIGELRREQAKALTGATTSSVPASSPPPRPAEDVLACRRRRFPHIAQPRKNALQ